MATFWLSPESQKVPLECFYEFHEPFSIRRERMSHSSAVAIFVHQSGLDQFLHMLTERLDVAVHYPADAVQSDAIVFSHDKKNFDPAMVGHAFQVPLHLPGRLLLVLNFSFLRQHQFYFCLESYA